VVPFFVRTAQWTIAAAFAHATPALLAMALLALVLFAGWVVADDGRTRRLARLIRAARRDARPAKRRCRPRRRRR
jgi:hypothetical protein